jgi:hypothetical protein
MSLSNCRPNTACTHLRWFGGTQWNQPVSCLGNSWNIRWHRHISIFPAGDVRLLKEYTLCNKLWEWNVQWFVCAWMWVWVIYLANFVACSRVCELPSLGFHVPRSPIVMLLFAIDQDKTMWLASWLPLLYCCCVDHIQFSQALSLLQWGWLHLCLLACQIPLNVVACLIDWLIDWLHFSCEDDKCLWSEILH